MISVYRVWGTYFVKIDLKVATITQIFVLKSWSIYAHSRYPNKTYWLLLSQKC